MPSLSFEGEILYNIYYLVDDLGDVELDDMGLLTWTTPQSDGTIYTADTVTPGSASKDGVYMVVITVSVFDGTEVSTFEAMFQ